MVSSPEELGLDKLIVKDPKLFYETIVRAIFRNPYKHFYIDDCWEEFWSAISEENKAKAQKVCHFYYYMCLPFKEDYNVPDAKRLVFTASIMESLMKEKHVEFYPFLLSKKLGNISRLELKSLNDEYLKEYGCNKKFRHYFKTYFLEEDLGYLCHTIKKEINGKLVALDLEKDKEVRLKDLSDFFYNLRSDVVHNANLLIVSNEVLGASHLNLKGRKYKLDLNIYDYLISFEKSLVKFFDSRSLIL